MTGSLGSNEYRFWMAGTNEEPIWMGEQHKGGQRLS